MSSTPTYYEDGEINPQCSKCNRKSQWAYIRECAKCKSYLCVTCLSQCKKCDKRIDDN